MKYIPFITLMMLGTYHVEAMELEDAACVESIVTIKRNIDQLRLELKDAVSSKEIHVLKEKYEDINQTHYQTYMIPARWSRGGFDDEISEDQIKKIIEVGNELDDIKSMLKNKLKSLNQQNKKVTILNKILNKIRR